MANDDGLIKIGTQVDLSGLTSGMSQAQAEVKSAMANMAEAQRQFGAAAAAGNAQATTILKEYQSELQSAQTKLASFAATEDVVSASTKAVAVEMRSLQTATSGVATATKSVTSNYYAAMGASELFRGRIPIRAMERFVAGSQTVGRVLQYAFPVIGAIALGEVLVQAGEKLYKFLEDTRELSAETGAGWLDSAIGQLDGLGDAAKQADEEVSKIASDLDKIASERQQETIREITRTQGPAAGDLARANLLSEQLTKNQALLQVLQAQRDVEAQQADEHKSLLGQAIQYGDNLVAMNRLSEGLEGGHGYTQDALKAQQALRQTKEQIRDLDQTDLNIVQEITDLQAEAADQKTFKTPAQREAEEAAREWQRNLQEMSRATDELVQKTSKSEADALERVGKLTAGAGNSPLLSSISRSISTTDNPEAQKALAQTAETIAHASEATKSLETDTKDLNTVLEQAEGDWVKLSDAQAEAYEIQQKNADSLNEATLRAREATHTISPLAAAEQQAALHTREYTEELARLNAQLEAQKELGHDVEASQTANQIAQLKGGRGVQSIQDQAAIQQQVAQPWLNAFQSINAGWLQVQNRMFYTTRNIGLEFAKMGQQIFISIVDNLEKAAIIAAERELMMLITHQTANKAKVASDSQAAAESNSISSISSLKEVTHAAATAAAKAYSAMAGIPIVGPVLGAVAAATTFAAVEAFGAMASLDTGTGFVPRDGVAMLHQGEIVVPAPSADELRNGNGGGDITINHTANINAVTDQAIIRAIHRNPREIATALKRHLRQAGKI